MTVLPELPTSILVRIEAFRRQAAYDAALRVLRSKAQEVGMITARGNPLPIGILRSIINPTDRRRPTLSRLREIQSFSERFGLQTEIAIVLNYRYGYGQIATPSRRRLPVARPNPYR